MPLVVNAIRRQSLLVFTLITTIVVAICAVFGSFARATDVTLKAAASGPHGPTGPTLAAGPRSTFASPAQQSLRPPAGADLRRPTLLGAPIYQQLSGVRVPDGSKEPVSEHSGTGQYARSPHELRAVIHIAG
jgi:hypothetical protein